MTANRLHFAKDHVLGKEEGHERQSGKQLQMFEAQVAVRAQKTDAQLNYPLLGI